MVSSIMISMHSKGIMRRGGPRIRAARRLSELLDHAPDNILIPSHSRDVVSAACVELHDQIVPLVPGSLSETEHGIVA